MYQEKKFNRVPFVSSVIERTPMRLMHTSSKQLHKGTKAGKKRHKSSQGKAQVQARKGAKAGNERHKGRQGKAQEQARKTRI